MKPRIRITPDPTPTQNSKVYVNEEDWSEHLVSYAIEEGANTVQTVTLVLVASVTVDAVYSADVMTASKMETKGTGRLTNVEAAAEWLADYVTRFGLESLRDRHAATAEHVGMAKGVKKGPLAVLHLHKEGACLMAPDPATVAFTEMSINALPPHIASRLGMLKMLPVGTVVPVGVRTNTNTYLVVSTPDLGEE